MTDAGKQIYEQGLACEKAGDVPGAFEAFRRSAKVNPKVAAPYVGLSRLLLRNHQRAKAIACLEHAETCEPANATVRVLLGRALMQDGQLDRAQQQFESAVRLDPNAEGAATGLAAVHEDLGARPMAARIYRHFLDRRPGHAEALAGLLGVADGEALEQAIFVARECLANAPEIDVALIGYALGKALDRGKDHDQAFAAWRTANGARRRVAGPFDRAAFDARVDRMIEIFSPEFFAARRDWGNPSARPVFVVGLPRSGTTLTEQILSGHPEVFGAGELDLLTDMATGTPDRLGQAESSWPETARALEQGHVSAIAADHLGRLAAFAPPAALRVVDKQPLNFWHLGLVAVVFPQARIVHCTRDIRDNGLSIFAENFTPEQRWATDLSDIAHYWRGYRRLMQHWAAVAPLRMLENSYEVMVDDIERAARRLVGFIDLPWDERCLAFHENARAVQTPSRWQVRQPVYSTSVERWRRYGPLIADLEVALSGEAP